MVRVPTVTSEFYVEVVGRMTEDDWRHAHTIAGEPFPGRFKEWVGEHAEQGGSAGYGFEPRGQVEFAALVVFVSQLAPEARATVTQTTAFPALNQGGPELAIGEDVVGPPDNNEDVEDVLMEGD